MNCVETASAEPPETSTPSAEKNGDVCFQNLRLPVFIQNNHKHSQAATQQPVWHITGVTARHDGRASGRNEQPTERRDTVQFPSRLCFLFFSITSVDFTVFEPSARTNNKNETKRETSMCRGDITTPQCVVGVTPRGHLGSSEVIWGQNGRCGGTQRNGSLALVGRACARNAN